MGCHQCDEAGLGWYLEDNADSKICCCKVVFLDQRAKEQSADDATCKLGGVISGSGACAGEQCIYRSKGCRLLLFLCLKSRGLWRPISGGLGYLAVKWGWRVVDVLEKIAFSVFVTKHPK